MKRLIVELVKNHIVLKRIDDVYITLAYVDSFLSTINTINYLTKKTGYQINVYFEEQ